MMLGCGQGHPALGSPATPLRRGGGPETFGGLTGSGAGEQKKQKLSCRNNDESCLLKKLPFKNKKKIGFVTEQRDMG